MGDLNDAGLKGDGGVDVGGGGERCAHANDQGDEAVVLREDALKQRLPPDRSAVCMCVCVCGALVCVWLGEEEV